MEQRLPENRLCQRAGKKIFPVVQRIIAYFCSGDASELSLGNNERVLDHDQKRNDYQHKQDYESKEYNYIEWISYDTQELVLYSCPREMPVFLQFLDR